MNFDEETQNNEYLNSDPLPFQNHNNLGHYFNDNSSIKSTKSNFHSPSNESDHNNKKQRNISLHLHIHPKPLSMLTTHLEQRSSCHTCQRHLSVTAKKLFGFVFETAVSCWCFLLTVAPSFAMYPSQLSLEEAAIIRGCSYQTVLRIQDILSNPFKNENNNNNNNSSTSKRSKIHLPSPPSSSSLFSFSNQFNTTLTSNSTSKRKSSSWIFDDDHFSASRRQTKNQAFHAALRHSLRLHHHINNTPNSSSSSLSSLKSFFEKQKEKKQKEEDQKHAQRTQFTLQMSINTKNQQFNENTSLIINNGEKGVKYDGFGPKISKEEASLLLWHWKRIASRNLSRRLNSNTKKTYSFNLGLIPRQVFLPWAQEFSSPTIRFKRRLMRNTWVRSPFITFTFEQNNLPNLPGVWHTFTFRKNYRTHINKIVKMVIIYDVYDEQVSISVFQKNIQFLRNRWRHAT